MLIILELVIYAIIFIIRYFYCTVAKKEVNGKKSKKRAKGNKKPKPLPGYLHV